MVGAAVVGAAVIGLLHDVQFGPFMVTFTDIITTTVVVIVTFACVGTATGPQIQSEDPAQV